MNTEDIIKNSDIAFGTSGARGLVEDFTPNVSAAFAIAFVNSIKQEFSFSSLAIAIDNRPSSYSIAQACWAGLKQIGIDVVYYGVLPTPALAYKAMQDGMPCIMVTGSHIPFDRNGLKFYRPDGEITKGDELRILNNNSSFTELDDNSGHLVVNETAKQDYIERYTSVFPNDIFKGKKIGIYEHSSAGREIYKQLFTALGAEVTSLGRSDEFVPIDTEAVTEEDKQRAIDWSKKYGFDAIFSTDGDGDRPLVSDENGNWLRGDVLGLICSKLLSVDALSVPISCNTAIEKSEFFKFVERTKIGSPYVIAEFDNLKENFKTFAGFEANGGYILGSDVVFNNKVIKALPTRDALLPFIVLLSKIGGAISDLVNELPERYTLSDRVKDYSKEKSLSLIKLGINSPELLLKKIKIDNIKVDYINNLDGLRLYLTSGNIIHFRPSGNAPELRCYVESSELNTAQQYIERFLKHIENL